VTAPDYADVIAERVIAEAGTSASIHDLVALAVRTGYELRDGVNA